MIEQVLELLFPSNIYCIACGNLIDNTRPYSLCDKCIREITWITDDSCEKCGKYMNRTRDGGLCYECGQIEHEFDKGFSCASYEGPVKEILSGLKYRGRTWYGSKMSRIMVDRAWGFINDIKPDMILPVPMHRKKQIKRGYNQSHLLAKGLAKELDIELRNDILLKTLNTASMSSLSSEERRINLHNAFEIGYNTNNDINGRNILIVDDVYTTGSTADACTEVLKKNGAALVYIYTFAAGVNMKKRLN